MIIWVQILCLAGKINDHGSVYMGQNLAYSDEMLATIFNHPVSTMQLALSTLESFDMIDRYEDKRIEVTNWEKHQSTDKMARIKQQNRERQQRHYYRSKLRRLGVDVDVEGFPDDSEKLKSLYEQKEEKPNVRLTLPNGQEVRGKKREVRSKKEIVETRPTSGEPDHIPYKEIVDHLNKQAERQFRHTTNKTKSMIKARWNEGFRLKDFGHVIDVKVDEWKNDAEMSKYLRPETLFGTKFEGYLNQELKSASKDASREAEMDFEELQKMLNGG